MHSHFDRILVTVLLGISETAIFLQTVVFLHISFTFSAFHKTAPVKLAITPFQNFFRLCFVAPSTTECVATFFRRGSVARATPGSRLFAKVRTRFQIHQVGVRVVSELGSDRHQPTAPRPHFCGPVESFPEEASDQSESRECPPASLCFAGTRHTVALAVHSHVVLDNLKEKNK